MLKSIDKNIIVKEVETKEYEKSGIIIKTNNLSNLIGNVISVGNEVKEINVGDKVIFSSEDARKIVYDANEYFVVDMKYVLAVI